MEVKYLAHLKQMQALEAIPALSAELGAVLGREQGGLLSSYRCEDADTVVVALGSVLGTIEDTVDSLRKRGVAIGALGIKAFRPFPLEDVRGALGRATRVVVIEKALALGIGGILAQNVRNAIGSHAAVVHTVIAGLGGRPITERSLTRLFEEAITGRLEPMTFLDLNSELVERELERAGAQRRSGPHAENMLRGYRCGRRGPGVGDGGPRHQVLSGRKPRGRQPAP